jgi:hypothetical protein
MNKTGRWHSVVPLVIFLTAASSSPQVSGQAERVSVEVVTEEGLRKISFDTPPGIIRVYLPDDMAVGDTVSGSITREARGKSSEERSENQELLGGYIIDFGDGTKFHADSHQFTWPRQKTKPSTKSIFVTRTINVVAANGDQIASAAVSVNSRAPTSPLGFKFPPLAQTGRPIIITGPFRGDAALTICSIGDALCQLVAESPRKGIFTSPLTTVGVTNLKISNGNKGATGQFRNIGINLTAPKTTLARGERTELSVQLSGLQGITTPISIQLVTTGAVNTQGGNDQIIQITPSMIDPKGTTTQTFTLNAVQAGSFNVTANLQTVAPRKHEH